jgi:hypothetical protein
MLAGERLFQGSEVADVAHGHLNGRGEGGFDGVAHKGGDGMPSRYRLADDFAASRPGGANDEQFHSKRAYTPILDCIQGWLADIAFLGKIAGQVCSLVETLKLTG